ncbi:MAG: hypothetical protein JWQ90_496 [Hydrocarboniphaga sp.]|uniref:peptidylprolyl isomerase n=1 Tax=Hydrocarboniphaga sp. TaxID=2033016 RepID=UPI00261ABF7F|nr:peptidylprolyl isomerase [Hydrocarboniphaga sp.]MDB5968046.1 hypothetical protein [Hydrocarboniphaga sp.]
MNAPIAVGAPTLVAVPAHPPRRGLLSRTLREPLLQFLLLGALLFVLAHVVEQHRQTAERQILIDDDTISRLVKLYEMQMGSAPSPARLEGIIEEHVRDEVLYREALHMGLDQNDEIVRRRLIQKLDFLNRDLTAVPEPDEAALRAYYDAHTSEFTEAPRVSFTHRYFSPDIDGFDGARRRAEDALRQLRLQGPSAAASDGDRFALQQGYAELSPPELVQIFGQFPIVEGLLRSTPGQWSGPLQSGYGWHLVQVTQRREAQVPPFETLRERVRSAWVERTRQQYNAASFDELRRRYEVVRADRKAQP